MVTRANVEAALKEAEGDFGIAVAILEFDHPEVLRKMPRSNRTVLDVLVTDLESYGAS